MSDAGNADQIAYWNDTAGPKWVANQERLDRLMAPLTAALLDAAAVRAGERVVDVGCGCGELSLHLAQIAGPDGRVTGVDVSAPMLAHARRRAEAATGGAPILWCRADAAAHPFAPEADLVASRFGVMFFADRARAFANLARALRPGGRIAMLAWCGRDAVEWMRAPLDWVAPVLPPPTDSNGAVGPFALADAEATLATLATAGFRAARAEHVERALVIGSDVEDAFATLADTGPVAALLREAEPDCRAAACDLLRAALRRRASGGPVTMSGACWIYHGVV